MPSPAPSSSTTPSASTSTTLPALLSHAHDPDFVLTAKGGPLGWAYAPNVVFDRNKDYATTVGELEDAIARNCRGPRWAELTERLARHAVVRVPTDSSIDLRTTLGLHTALTRLGYEVGRVDGILGPKTRAGVVAFQKDHRPRRRRHLRPEDTRCAGDRARGDEHELTKHTSPSRCADPSEGRRRFAFGVCGIGDALAVEVGRETHRARHHCVLNKRTANVPDPQLLRLMCSNLS